MKTFLKLNGLSKTRITLNSHSVDEAYLRVRHQYHPLALYLHERKEFKDADEATNPDMKYIYHKEPILFTDDLMKCLCRVDLPTYALLLHSHKGQVFHALLTPPEIMGLYLGLTDSVFDFGESSHILIPAFKNTISLQNAPNKRSLFKALDILHHLPSLKNTYTLQNILLTKQKHAIMLKR